MSERRPLVGVTGPDRGGAVAWAFLWLAVRRAGGRPLRMRPARPGLEPGEEQVLDALLISGGADVDPGRYGQRPVKLRKELAREKRRPLRYVAGLLLLPVIHVLRRALSLKSRPGPDPARDALEERVLASALERGIPVLGICRGMQFINVQFGGSLHQDLAALAEERPEMYTLLPRKSVTLAGGSRLRAILGRRKLRVNALHSQGVDRLGNGLSVTARDRHGIVQGLEHAERPFVLGVQWHPEFLPHLRRQQRIFRALVAAAR